MLKALKVAGADMDIISGHHHHTTYLAMDNPLLLNLSTDILPSWRLPEKVMKLLVEAGANRSIYIWRNGETTLSLAKTEAIKAILCS